MRKRPTTHKTFSQRGPSLSDLPSLGATSAELLSQVGILDAESLRELGSIECFTVLRTRFGKRITVNWIYALECAIRDMNWRLLHPERKAELRAAARQVIADIDSPK